MTRQLERLSGTHKTLNGSTNMKISNDRIRRFVMSALILAGPADTLSITDALAQHQVRQYAAKFLCGRSEGVGAIEGYTKLVSMCTILLMNTYRYVTRLLSHYPVGRKGRLVRSRTSELGLMVRWNWSARTSSPRWRILLVDCPPLLRVFLSWKAQATWMLPVLSLLLTSTGPLSLSKSTKFAKGFSTTNCRIL